MTTHHLSQPETPVTRRHYTEAEARRILEYAVADQLQEKDFSHEQLEAMARELGISAESLALAERQWRAEESVESVKADEAVFERHRQWVHQTTLKMFLFTDVSARKPPYFSRGMKGVARPQTERGH